MIFKYNHYFNQHLYDNKCTFNMSIPVFDNCSSNLSHNIVFIIKNSSIDYLYIRVYNSKQTTMKFAF